MAINLPLNLLLFTFPFALNSSHSIRGRGRVGKTLPTLIGCLCGAISTTRVTTPWASSLKSSNPGSSKTHLISGLFALLFFLCRLFLNVDISPCWKSQSSTLRTCLATVSGPLKVPFSSFLIVRCLFRLLAHLFSSQIAAMSMVRGTIPLSSRLPKRV